MPRARIKCFPLNHTPTALESSRASTRSRTASASTPANPQTVSRCCVQYPVVAVRKLIAMLRSCLLTLFLPVPVASSKACCSTADHSDRRRPSSESPGEKKIPFIPHTACRASNRNLVSVVALGAKDIKGETEGMQIIVYDLGGYGVDSRVAFVDYDEIDGLMSGVDYISAISAIDGTTRLKSYEAVYSTRGQLEISVHSNSSGGRKVAIEIGSSGTTKTTLTLDQLAKVKTQ